MSAMLNLTLIFSIPALFKEISVCSKIYFFFALDIISFEKVEKTLVLNKYNGLPSLKNQLPSIGKYVSQLSLIPSSALQEYLLRHSTIPKAKELGDKLYEILSKSYTPQPELYDGKRLEDHPLAMQIHSEVEAEGLGKEFAGWYFERGFKSSYFRSWNRSERRYNWQMSQSWVLYLASLAIKPSLIQLTKKRDSSSFTYNDITS